MRKLAAVIAVLLLLAGVGFGGWWFFLRVPPSTAGEAVAEGPPAFVTLPVMTIPVIRGDRVSDALVLQVTLELAGAESQEAAKAAIPYLVDAFLTELHALLGRRLMVERDYDAGIIKTRLERVASRVLGAGRVADILIRVIAER